MFTNKNSESNNNNEDTVASLDVNSKMFNWKTTKYIIKKKYLIINILTI